MAETKKKIVSYAQVMFEDNLIPCAIGDDLFIYIPISGICDILGIDTDAQVARIREHHSLRQGLFKIDFPVQYGQGGATRMTEVNAISITRFHTWLATISIDRLQNEAIKPALAKMQENLADTIYATFGRALMPPDLLAEQEANLPPAVASFYQAMSQAHRDHETLLAMQDRLAGLEDRLHGLEVIVIPAENEETINDQQAALVKKWVEIIGDLLERRGRGSYNTVHQELKDQFRFTKYKLMPKRVFPQVRAYCVQWYRKLVPPGTPLPSALVEPEQQNLF